MASYDDFELDVEKALNNQIGAVDLPFPGMDKSGAAVCVYYLKGQCDRDWRCPFRHIKGERTIVCKHWLRGLCKKGDQCEFLHEYDLTKMPECYFYSRFHACSNKECPFLHIDPESKIKDCPWYDRGFCRHGPNCRHRHTRRVLCILYLDGFCPSGPECRFVHPRFDLPVSDQNTQNKKGTVICHHCNEVGHKIYNCPKMPPEAREEAINNKLQQLEAQNSDQQFSNPSMNHHHRPYHRPQQIRPHFNSPGGGMGRGGGGGPGGQGPMLGNSGNDMNNGPREKVHRPLDQVTCFKCGEKGHYANKCPKGHLAFLSSALKDLQEKRGTT